jgi:hypothetical protein
LFPRYVLSDDSSTLENYEKYLKKSTDYDALQKQTEVNFLKGTVNVFNN